MKDYFEKNCRQRAKSMYCLLMANESPDGCYMIWQVPVYKYLCPSETNDFSSMKEFSGFYYVKMDADVDNNPIGGDVQARSSTAQFP